MHSKSEIWDVAPYDAETSAGFLGHPKGLAVLLTTEGMERFAYYGMQALLVLYMTKNLLVRDDLTGVWLLPALQRLLGGLEGQPLASAIFGLYGGLIFIAPVFGGYAADRFLGKRFSIVIGGCIMAMGHFLLMWDAAFLMALLCIIVGTGFFKSNITSQVGELYPAEDARRNDAYQLFVLSVSIGGIGAPLIIGTLGEKGDWHLGFGAAGIAMLVSLAVYVAGFRWLPTEKEVNTSTNEVAANAHHQSAAYGITPIIALMLIFPVLLIPNMQLFNAYLVWGDSNFDLEIQGVRLPSSWLLFADAVIGVFAITASLAFWKRLRARNREPDGLGKILIGSLFVIGGMLVLALAAALMAPDGKISLLWVVLFHLVNNIGYAQILPVGLALFGRLAPPMWVSTIIGIFYASVAVSSILAGYIGTYLTSVSTAYFWLGHAGLAAACVVALGILKLMLGTRARSETSLGVSASQ